MVRKNGLSGSLNLILGPMYSGKTSTLITRYNRHIIANRNCIMVKYKNDTRYDDKMIVTHNGIKIEAVITEELADLDHLVKDVDVVCIDEVQFYKDAHVFCDKWANEGIIIEACGLNGTFERKPFHIISLLIPQCNNIEYITAICRETGNNGHYSKRNTDDMEEEVIGGTDIYSAVDRETFFDSSNSWYTDSFIEYAKTFSDKHNIEFSDKLIDTINKIDINKQTNYKKLIQKLTSNNIGNAYFKDKRVIIRVNHEASLETIELVLKGHPTQIVLFVDEALGLDLNKVKQYIIDTLRINVKPWNDDHNYTFVIIQSIDVDKLLSTKYDIYINDALDDKLINTNFDEKYMGLTLKKETEFLVDIFYESGRSIFIIGAESIDDNLTIIDNMINKAHTIIIGNKLSLLFLRYVYNINIGDSITCDERDMKQIGHILDKAKINKVNIRLPLDFICRDKDGLTVNQNMDTGIPYSFTMIDIGPNTDEYFSAMVNDADAIVWKGSLGTETTSTDYIMRRIATMDRSVVKVIVGDDLLESCSRSDLTKEFDHISNDSKLAIGLLSGKS